MTTRLSPIFQHDFKAPVWQIAVDAGKGLLALEIRDHKKAEVSFSLFSSGTRSLVFDRYALEEDWWVSLAGLKNDRLLIKQYHDSQQPEKQGLVAINIATMEVDWWKEDFQLDELSENGVTGMSTKNGERIRVALDLCTGDESVAERSEPESSLASVQYPVHYLSSDSHFSTISKFLAGMLNVGPVGACDYLEMGEFILLSYFILEEQKLTNELAVFTRDGEEVLHQTLGSQLEALASGTFFVFNNYLVFVANKTQLCVYELP